MNYRLSDIGTIVKINYLGHNHITFIWTKGLRWYDAFAEHRGHTFATKRTLFCKRNILKWLQLLTNFFLEKHTSTVIAPFIVKWTIYPIWRYATYNLQPKCIIHSNKKS